MFRCVYRASRLAQNPPSEAADRESARILADAIEESRRIVDAARAEAISLTRNAIMTVDGLRRLAAEAPDTTTE